MSVLVCAGVFDKPVRHYADLISPLCPINRQRFVAFKIKHLRD